MSVPKVFGGGVVFVSTVIVVLLCSCLAVNAGQPVADKPGILIGQNQFVKTVVYERPGWMRSGIFDKKEGLEIAVMDSRQITFLDPNTYKAKRIIPVHYDGMSWSTELVSLRADGKLNFVMSGGGFSEVGLLNIDGHLLWKFRSKSLYFLQPDKMIAFDLDSDGEKEFYVADHKGVFRLDKNGKVVWRASRTINHYIFTVPEEGVRPAAVVTETGMWDAKGNLLQRINSSADTYMFQLFKWVWEATGNRLQGINSSAGTYKLQLVKWEGSYCLASGQTSSAGSHVFIFDFSGNIIFKQKIGDHFGVNDILAVRFKPAEKPCLVVIGGRGHGYRMMELNIFSHDGNLVYKELRDSAEIRVIPNETTGADTLLLSVVQKIEKYEKL